jgi:endoglucanase
MRRLSRQILLAAALAFSAWTDGAAAQGTVGAADWTAYKDRFLAAEGRIVDDANGDISHSEGQGYGMLLAYLADSRADFDRIWAFTRAELLLRDDGLVMWKWDPAATPHVTDTNNASDGDLLIAYALTLAGEAWSRRDLTAAAVSLGRAIMRSNVRTVGGRLVLMPAATGFEAKDRPDGPVVNLSYWVFEAFPALAQLLPEHQWAKLSNDGLDLLEQTLFGKSGLPPDWTALTEGLPPARGFAPEFGYNALRIPLYLVRAGNRDAQLLGAFASGITGPDGALKLVDIPSGAQKAALSDPGYRAIPAALACVVGKTPLPDDLKTFQPTQYYPSTLHLLTLSFLRSRYPDCL